MNYEEYNYDELIQVITDLNKEVMGLSEENSKLYSIVRSIRSILEIL